MTQWLIYKHTSIESGKSYIGLTKHLSEFRWKQHCSTARSNGQYHFHRAIRLYGEKNWKHEVLATGLNTIEEAGALEKHYIRLYNTFENGYNSTIGGEGVATISDVLDTDRLFKHTDGTIFNGSVRELQAEFNLPCISNIDKLIAGSRYSMYSWQIVDTPASELQINPTEGCVIYKYTPTLDYVGKFYSAMQASKSVGIKSQDKIYNRCKNNYISQEFKGYKWSFLSPEELHDKIEELGEVVVFHYKGVLRLFKHTNGSEFIGTSRNFAKMVKCDEGRVSVLVNKSKDYNGWSFVANIEKDT